MALKSQRGPGVNNIPARNSCRVTKYTRANSFIPGHSDNERSIHAESSIFTVSVGLDATVQFREVHDGSIQEQVVKEVLCTQ